MKKILLYLFLIILCAFFIPILFTIQFSTASADVTDISNLNSTIAVETEIPKFEPYDYKQYATIKLLHHKTGEIEELGIDEYLYGVVSAEMPVDFELEALKAQSLVARTYTLYKVKGNNGKHDNADICDDSGCCQAWISKEDRFAKWDLNVQEENWNKIVNAVNSTAGKIITYNGEPINAFFHSNSGGSTEIPLNVWGGSGYPYLQVVETAGEDAYSQYSSEVN